MYYLDKIVLKNFMGYEDEVHEVTHGQATMVFGVNETDEGQNSNGTGKSGILEAVAILATGTVLRKDTSAKDLVRDGCKSFELEGHFSSTHNNELLVIKREVFANTKSSTLVIEEDGVPVKDIVSVDDGNRWILDKLDLTKDDVLSYYLISKERYKSFPVSTDTERKAIINRFAQADKVNPADDLIKIDVDVKVEEVTKLEAEKNRNLGKLEALNEQLLTLPSSKDLEKRRIAKLLELDLALADSKLHLSNLNVESKRLTTNKSLLDKELEILQASEVDTTEMDKLKAFEAQLQEEHSKVKREVGEIEGFKEDLSSKIQGAIECPKCAHEFSLRDAEFDVDKAKETVLSAEAELKELYEVVDFADQQIAETRESIIKLRKVQDKELDKQTEVKRKIGILVVDISVNDRKTTAATTRVEDVEEEIVTVTEYEISDGSLEIKNGIKATNTEIERIEEALEIKAQEKFELEEWRGRMKKFKNHLTVKAIGAVQYHVNDQLRKMKSNLTVQVDGFTENRANKVTDKISIKILKDGEESGSFGRLSSGEKVRVEVAFIYAFQTLINSNSDSGGLDLTILDEITNSLDTLGIENMMDVLNDLHKDIYVITHASFNKTYPHTLTVVKKGGISEFQ